MVTNPETVQPHYTTHCSERLKPVHYEEEQEEDMETEAAPQESVGGWTEVKPDSEKPSTPGVSLSEV